MRPTRTQGLPALPRPVAARRSRHGQTNRREALEWSHRSRHALDAVGAPADVGAQDRRHGLLPRRVGRGSQRLATVSFRRRRGRRGSRTRLCGSRSGARSGSLGWSPSCLPRLSLRGFAAIGIDGDQAAARDLAAAICCSCARSTVRICCRSPWCVDPTPAASGLGEMASHAQHSDSVDGLGPSRMIYGSVLELDAALGGQLAMRGRFSRTASPVQGVPQLVVVVDGGILAGDIAMVTDGGARLGDRPRPQRLLPPTDGHAWTAVGRTGRCARSPQRRGRGDLRGRGPHSPRVRLCPPRDASRPIGSRRSPWQTGAVTATVRSRPDGVDSSDSATWIDSIPPGLGHPVRDGTGSECRSASAWTAALSNSTSRKLPRTEWVRTDCVSAQRVRANPSSCAHSCWASSRPIRRRR